MGACLRCCYKCVDYEPINEQAVDLSHFTLHRVLGRGGFGKVSVAESRLNSELFAIKAMSKRWLLQSASNVKSVWLERHIMIQVRSNFLVHTAYAFQDGENIYLVMKFLPGGDLHYLLYQGNQLTGTKNQEAPGAKPLPEDHVRFYMVEILLGLEEMHLVGLVYRDLKPENILLDGEGHVYLSDFGLAGDLNAEADGLTVGACGTPGYQARELLSNHPYDFTPDVYAFGVVMYELLHGGVPGLYEDPRQLRFRSNLSSACIDLLVQLLQHDPNVRIGCDIQRTHRWNDVKAHPFFAKVNWDRAQRKAIRPPFRPAPDTANCDPMYELEEQLRETPAVQPQPLSEKEQAVFKGWEYHTDPVYHSKDLMFEPNEQSVFSLSASGANNSAGASSQQPASISPSGVALLAGNKVGASSMTPSFTHSRNPTTEMSILVRPSETARDKDESASSARSKHLSEEEKAEYERAALAAAAAASLISSHPTQAPSRNKPSRQGQSQSKSNGGAVVHVQPKAVDLHAVRVAMPDEDIKEGNEEEE